MKTDQLQYRVGVLGAPSWPEVAWSRENLERLKALGFNTMQLHIAWGARPGDEPLNLEDVVDFTPAQYAAYGQDGLVPRADNAPAATRRRRENLRQRIALCRELGLRTLFHFGAPYNMQYAGGVDMEGRLPRCLLDGQTPQYYAALFEAFAEQYPGVDDLLLYTYDQDAWLCSEFGHCENCRGIPLAERVTPFLNRLAAVWRRLSPHGRIWWSPWELSAGQVLQCIDLLEPEGLGLLLHPNIAETMATLPVDRWLKNACTRAAARGLPVLVEGFWGAPSEEVEPFNYLAHPLVTYRQYRAIAAVPGVSGIKEYYGLLPFKEDPNLRMTGLLNNDLQLGEEEALRRLAEPYGAAAGEVAQVWRLSSEAQETFPWDTSWMTREMGKSDVTHSMSAGFIRGQMCSTPDWDSSRKLIFMKTDSEQPHPWLLEDIELRCRLTAEKIEEALQLGQAAIPAVPPSLKREFTESLADLAAFRRRALSYTHHLRETNLATVMRAHRAEGQPLPDRLITEMRDTLRADHENQLAEYRSRFSADGRPLTLEGARWIWHREGQSMAQRPFSPRCFRRAFDLRPDRWLAGIGFNACCSENWLRLTVNGRELFAGAPLRALHIDTSDGLFQSGPNVAAITVSKAGSEFTPPGLVGKLVLYYADGTIDEILTDDTWRSSTDEQPDWTDPGFDDASWSAAEDLGPFGGPPWGDKCIGDGAAAINEALVLFNQDPAAFLDHYLQVVPDQASRGLFTTTSR